MDLNCNIHEQSIHMENLKQDVSDLKEKLSEVNKDIIELKTNRGISDEQIKVIFTMLNEIKQKIDSTNKYILGIVSSILVGVIVGVTIKAFTLILH